MEAEAIKNANLLLETRLTKVEVSYASMADDIREIKLNIRWVMGLIFSINTTIIGLLAKGFNLF